MVNNLNINSENIQCKFTGLTKNTIIICANEKIKQKLVDEFYEIISDMEFNKQSSIEYERTSIINLRLSQTIIATTEHGFLLTAKKPEDIWFVDENEGGIISGWAFTDFIGYRDIWKQGLFCVYKCFTDGLFGLV